ncbi:MAG TPA: hypothetical protein VK622_12240 [Puia sp.]|nr:hypothetical protein [Puia sp.]
MSLVSAYILYDGNSGTFVGDQNKTIQINCERMRAYSPRPAWLLRRLMPGDGTQIQSLLTFELTSNDQDANTLQGYAIEVDGQDSMIDIVTWEALINACNCPDCDDPDGNPVARFYSSGTPAFTPLTLNTYCITRNDDGTGYDHDVAVMAYTGRYVGNMRLRSNLSGVSHYQIEAYSKPQSVGSDVVNTGICTS